DIHPEPRGDMAARVAIYSLAAAEVVKDNRPSRPEQSKLAQQYAGIALKLLTTARSRGFFNDPANVEQLKRNHDFKPLGHQEGFQKFLRELERKSIPSSRSESSCTS